MNPDRWLLPLVGATCLCLAAAPALAQERMDKEDAAVTEAQYEAAAMMEAWQKAGTPGYEHARLEEMTGTWDLEIRTFMDPSGEPTVTRGTSTARMTMDGRFLVEEVSSEFMGAPFRGLGTTGYNNVSGEYEGTWVDNHSTAIHNYSGDMNEAGNQLVMAGSYLDPVTGEVKKTRGVLTIVSPDEMRYESFEIGQDGSETRSMEISYRRQS